MSTLGQFAAVAAGGSLGACARYAVSVFIMQEGWRFPYATLLVNVSGALIAGFLVSVLVTRDVAGSVLYLLLITGFLGSFTTFSAFSIETLKLVQSGALLAAGINVVITVLGVLVAVTIGFSLGRLL